MRYFEIECKELHTFSYLPEGIDMSGGTYTLPNGDGGDMEGTVHCPVCGTDMLKVLSSHKPKHDAFPEISDGLRHGD